jgi:GDP-L-fucose synthase
MEDVHTHSDRAGFGESRQRTAHVMDTGSRIFVAGHRGLIGSALLRRLRTEGYAKLLTRTRAELDLTDPGQVERFFASEAPEYVFLAAGKVGGIEANRMAPADFIRTNLAIQTSVLPAAHANGVRKLVFFGSTCMYPRDASQPMPEESLMSGRLEATSDAYAVAKLAGLMMCEAYNRQHGTRFVTLIPASAYGPHDHFDGANAHVLAALMRKFHEASVLGTPVVVWGTGSSRREFIHVDDVVDACLFVMRTDTPHTVLNVGVGDEIAIRDLAARIMAIIGRDLEFTFDRTRPDGAPRKLLDSSRLRRLGWSPKMSLADGIVRTYAWYRSALGAPMPPVDDATAGHRLGRDAT